MNTHVTVVSGAVNPSETYRERLYRVDQTSKIKVGSGTFPP
jgi:hypothetical protein